MPSLKHHLQQDQRLFGARFDAVHTILDQFAHYPDRDFLQRHRKFLHHKEGIEYITMRFGDTAGLAAKQHVLDDCGHVPSAIDYYTGRVDAFGHEV